MEECKTTTSNYANLGSTWQCKKELRWHASCSCFMTMQGMLQVGQSTI